MRVTVTFLKSLVFVGAMLLAPVNGCVRGEAGLADTGVAVPQAGVQAGSMENAQRPVAANEPYAAPGQQAQAGLPEARVSFANPDGSVVRFVAEVASTEAQRMTGLMFRPSLAPDRAMIFVFPDEAVRGFYMKNTLVALDMVFVGANGVVAGVVENARPLTLDSRTVDAPAMFVVEINAWEATRNGIGRGSVMSVTPASVLSF